MYRMRTLPIAEARQFFTKLVDEVSTGQEEIIITKHGKPVARLGPIEEKAQTTIPLVTNDFEVSFDEHNRQVVQKGPSHAPYDTPGVRDLLSKAFPGKKR